MKDFQKYKAKDYKIKISNDKDSHIALKNFEKTLNFYDKDLSPDNLIDFYRDIENDYSKIKEKKELNSKELNEYLVKFNSLSELFSEFYDAFFFFSLGAKIPLAKSYLDACSTHISKIQNIFVSQLTNTLTLKKAKISILVGNISMGLGVIAIFLSIWLSYDSANTIQKLENKVIDIKNANDSILKNQLKYDNSSIIRFEKLYLKLDTIKHKKNIIQ